MRCHILSCSGFVDNAKSARDAESRRRAAHILRATENGFGIAACRQTDSPGEHGSGAESAVYAACVVGCAVGTT